MKPIRALRSKHESTNPAIVRRFGRIHRNVLMKATKYATLLFVTGSAFAIHAVAGEFKHITVDGSFEDWAGVPPAYEDLAFQDDPRYQADPTPFAGVTDLKSVYLAHDYQYLYVRLTLYAPGNPFTAQNNIFIDADNASTGFSAFGLIGSEMLIQSGTGYQEKNGAFVDDVTPNSIGGLDWAAAPAGDGTNFEFRISRKATYDFDNLPVFTGDTIAIVLEAENSHFATQDTAPDDQGLVYTFTPAPPAATSNLALLTLTGSTWQVNASGSDLGTAWREVDFDDTQAGWAPGAGLFGFTTNATAYPVPIQTPLSSSNTTYYLRARFQWTNDPASVILVASNYLSDGAVFYLNGAEVKRIRLPGGNVAFNTSANGGPLVTGQPELVGLATGPLLIGTNVLAVEVHQTGGDTNDLVFGMSLLAATQYPVIITDPLQPADRSTGAGDPTTFSAEFIGTPPLSFQWLKDNNAIADATNATLTIDTVLQEDAGAYSLRIVNPFSTNLTRAAILTVTNSPLRITDAAQPADQTVTEGLPATFTVPVVGSAPISYQWFKGTTPIADATNATYTIADVAIADAGDYHAIATNPFPSSVTSRTAHLTVAADTNGPTVLNVAGTPNKVTINFSEPVTPASANAITNYSLTSGLAVTGAILDTNDPSKVVLTTGPQTLGTTYTLTVNNVLDRFTNSVAPNTQITFRSSIVIDGSFGDWASVPLAFTDAQDSTESIDYKDVYIASDDQYIYVRVSLYSPGDPADFHNNVFIDADNNPATGFGVGGIGSEMLIQSGVGYQEKNGGFNEGDINGLDYAIAPTGNATDFEFRFSRNATYATGGLAVFTTNSLTIALEAESSGFATKDIAPDSGGFVYTIAAGTQLGPLGISGGQGQATISWSGPGKLQSRLSLTSGTWQDVPNAISPYIVQTTNTQSFFRLMQ